MKITDNQRRHLQVLLAGGPRSSYPGLNIGVLNSLALKRLVTAERRVGSIASPRTHIKWQITMAGRAALNMEELSKERDCRSR